MDKKFQNEVQKVAELVRRREYQAIGNSEFAKNKCVQKRLGSVAEMSPVYMGRVVMELFRDVIETTFKPASPQDITRREWRTYLILSEFVLQGFSWGEIANELCISKSTFYQEREKAFTELVLALWDLEETARIWPQVVMTNLPEAPFTQYIPIEDENGNDYASVIVNALLKSRDWVFVIGGPAGVGKTSLGYEVAKRSLIRNLFNAIIWTTAKREEFQPSGLEHGQPSVAPVTTLASILDSIGSTIGIKKILATASVSEKVDIVSTSLMSINCLLIIDNLETIGENVQADIFEFLDTLPGPSKALITSRRRIFRGGQYYTLAGLTQSRAFQLMDVEARFLKFRNLEREEKEAIYRAASGNPMAMKMAMALLARGVYRVQDEVGIGIEQDTLLSFMYEATYEKLLTENDRKVLHVMPLFAESATMNEIAAAADIGPIQVEVSVSHLTDTYLVVLVSARNTPEQERFEILPSMREFLRRQREVEGFAVGGEAINDFITRANEKIAQYYSEHLKDIGAVDGKIAFLSSDRNNLLSAMSWCYENQKWELLIDLVQEICPTLGFVGLLDERETWARRAIEACEQLDDKERQYWFTVRDIVWVMLQRGNTSRAREVIEICLQQAKLNQFERIEALCYSHSGRIARDEQRYDEAQNYFEKSIEIWRRIGKTMWTAYPLAKLGEMYMRIGELDRAQRYLEKAFEIQKDFNNKGEIAQTMSDLAFVFAKKRQKTKAVEWAEKSISVAKEMPPPTPAYAYGLYRRAQIEMEFGSTEDASKYAQGALRLYSDLGVVPMVNTVQRFIDEVSQPKRK